MSVTPSTITVERKKQNVGAFFFGSNYLAMALIANVLAMCHKSDISVVQTHVPGQSSQESDFIVI